MPRTTVRHADEGDFQPVAPGTSVRDLGIGDLTGGELIAQVVRIEPEGAHVEKLHRHDEGFSLAYVLKGWLDVEFEEIGVQHLGPGTVIPAFNGPMHRELTCGDGFELLLLVTRKSLSGDDRQRIIVQQERDAEFEAGPRDGLLVRDFGLKELTGGRMLAHAIKALPGKHPHADWRTHDLHCHLDYVVNGWVDLEYEDIGTVRLEKGSLVYQPPMIRRVEIAHGNDLVIVEVATPATTASLTAEPRSQAPTS